MKFFIYFATTSYTSPESFHSDMTVTQDQSIWYMAIKAKTSTESTDYYCFPFKNMLDEEIRGSYFLKVYIPHSPVIQ